MRRVLRKECSPEPQRGQVIPLCQRRFTTKARQTSGSVKNRIASVRVSGSRSVVSMAVLYQERTGESSILLPYIGNSPANHTRGSVHKDGAHHLPVQAIKDPRSLRARKRQGLGPPPLASGSASSRDCCQFEAQEQRIGGSKIRGGGIRPGLLPLSPLQQRAHLT